MVDRYQFGPFNSEDGTMSLMHPSLSPTEKLVRYSDYQKLEAALHKAFSQFENITVAGTLEIAKDRAHSFIGWYYNNIETPDGSAPETFAEPAIDQAPIARVIVTDDAPAGVVLYAPGLPPGEFDVYLEPTKGEQG